MPHRPPHACAVPLCPNTTQYRYCTAHEHLVIAENAAQDKERPQSQERGYGVRWRRYRSWYLKNNPLCRDPYNRHHTVVAATQVDHIEPHKMNPKLFWDPHNHQPLCASCGAYKSSVERGGRAHSDKQQLADVSGAAAFPWRKDA